MYLGAADVNYMEQERKDFERTDYADREFPITLGAGGYLSNYLKFSSVSDLDVGDVLTQDQTLTIYTFNALLEKLDTDLDPTATEYYSALMASPGDNLRTKLVSLAQRLDSDVRISATDYESSIADYSGSISSVSAADPTVITTSASHNLVSTRRVTIAGTSTTPDTNGTFNVTVTGASTFTIPIEVTTGGGASGTWDTDTDSFEDIKACYNIIIDKLNNDSGLDFTNYLAIDENSLMEAVILSINTTTNRVELNVVLPFIQGELTVYESFESATAYSPQTMGDPLGLKQVYEATVMFENKNFTKASLGFSTDLLPERIDVPISGRGNGLFGHNRFGGGFFGGIGASAPFRTYVPRQCQRCRYINLRFSHSVARESYTVFGVTLTGNISQSTRAYRG